MTREQLEKNIYEAFKDVKLEDGIGLKEANLIDDYCPKDDPEYIEARAADERNDWTKLLPDFGVNLFSGVWHFMDAKGIRFHLPCFLLENLDALISSDNPLIFTLKGPVNDSFNRLKILNSAQKQVVVDFINYKLAEAKCEEYNYDFITNDYKQAKENFEKYIMNSQVAI